MANSRLIVTLALAMAGAGCEIFVDGVSGAIPDVRGQAAGVSTVSESAARDALRADANQTAGARCGPNGVESLRLDDVDCENETLEGITEWTCDGEFRAWCNESTDAW